VPLCSRASALCAKASSTTAARHMNARVFIFPGWLACGARFARSCEGRDAMKLENET
jgi:hypothetical protein